MFDVDSFYEECSSGRKVDNSAIREYLCSFDRIIIWGSAGLGKAIGNLIEHWGVKETIYWDQRFDEIGKIGNNVVEAPFSKEYDRDKSLLMYSIPNHVIMNTLMNQARKHGYQH